MSKVGWCPVCGQPAKKKKAMKRLENWLGQARLDRILKEGAALPATGRVVKWDSTVPALTPEEQKLRRAMQKKVYMKAWHAKKKAEREAAAAAKEKPQATKQLEHQRAYNRSYYHRNKRHLYEMRKRREARARASNGHQQHEEQTDGS